MSKRQDLLAAYYKEGNVIKKEEIKKQIIELEDYCINVLKYDFKRTDFNKKKTYRFEGVKDGGWNIPKNAKTGNDRCPCCKYNKHSYCGGEKPCWANV